MEVRDPLLGETPVYTPGGKGMPAPNFLKRSSACTTQDVVNDVGCVLPTSNAKRCSIISPGLWGAKDRSWNRRATAKMS